MKLFLSVLVIVLSTQITQTMIPKALARLSITAQMRVHNPATRFFCTDTTHNTVVHQCANCAKLPKNILRWLEAGFSQKQPEKLGKEELKHPKIAHAIRLFTQMQTQKEELWEMYHGHDDWSFDTPQEYAVFDKENNKLMAQYQKDKEKLLSPKQKLREKI